MQTISAQPNLWLGIFTYPHSAGYLATFDVGHIPKETLWGETRGLAATTVHEFYGQSIKATPPCPVAFLPCQACTNAQAMIFVLVAFQINRKLGYVMLAFLAVTFVG